ncbi:N-acetyl-alpha-D-glucosaminyl-diphospho-ditrans, octacis-undecaprenol 4-epimerase [Flavobacterium bizetiae]|uniref:N-acetyl-alpha-D-glucosaminyl-diphospho-ditrans, octacis-undecaprenol 4-epimerase n=1 Tax=Flavobacterium bizetiae TaxID=2704140 RepID=A0A6J4H1M5_9FLAO|nr:NAD-dependent epimerase/dehydratase family protein [Flavobacterium bizetiae]CAA9203653.1 N-acetyl-alpha-D-glucosaminyl-diphospho-ditrans, octacis-undecaprenol 4-epimerase [Flavobacterium bizetiae]CAD5344732.1 N-acetyl-alpha-D-glucosaminyl-diphospho-ditrans, octacis-undecaprenol 4-epimerase [Flavobacterium bizetiae]CAD5350983.1 N-acetyl-alpha-D-glucosaminyl-diphospho-ditrans, octacis-undecaprenol 4-epimerase [Flavobacterium bizetiae]
MVKVAITGSTGFVGTNLKSYLHDTYHIESLSVRYVPNQKFTIETDVLIHLAGKAHDLKKVSKPDDYYEANFELTKQLFDSFLSSDASVFIFMSTVKSVADKVNGILTEDIVPDPKTHYGIAKYKAEEYILRQKLPESKRVYILRPCMIHGPENKGNLNLLYKLVSKGVPWPLASYKNERSFLSIENLCFIVKTIIENKKIESGIYHIADDEFVSTNELIKIISSVTNKKNVSIAIPKFIIGSFAKVGDFIKFPLNSETLQKLTENYKVSNEKIKKAIGIEKLPNSAQKGLERTIKSFTK